MTANTAQLVLDKLEAGRGRPLSGQQIADELNVSRNAVWKAVGTLRERGCVIDAGPRAGYTLVSIPEMLDEAHVLPGIGHDLYRAIRFVPTVDSTNDVAKQLAKEGAPEGTVVIAERQEQGRGRRGRAWETGAGQSLLFSIVLRPPLPPRQAPLFVFMAAAAVREALAPYGPTFIKWPNDVLAEDRRKLCGILVEMDAEHDHIKYCVVGIGINVNQRPQDFARAVQDRATSVKMMHGSHVDRLPLLQTVLRKFAERYDAVKDDAPATDRFASVLQEARRFSATIGRSVQVQESGGTDWYGTAVDIRSDGALLVRPAGEREPVAVYAADVSIRTEGQGDDDES